MTPATSAINMVEWEATRQFSVRVAPLLYLVFLLVYVHKIVSQNFLTLVMYISKSRQVFIIKLSFWTRVRFLGIVIRVVC